MYLSEFKGIGGLVGCVEKFKIRTKQTPKISLFYLKLEPPKSKNLYNLIPLKWWEESRKNLIRIFPRYATTAEVKVTGMV